MSSRTPQSVGELVSKFITVRYGFIIGLKRSYDDWALKQIWHNFKLKTLLRNQKLQHGLHADLGSDIATSKFVINYCSGQVRNEQGRWLSKESELPKYYTKSFKLTGLSARKAGLITEGIDNFVSLNNLESIDLSGNDRLDNFSCDQLSRQFKGSKTLKEINLSQNPRISIHGLNILFRIPSLKKIIAVDTAASNSEEIDLFVLAAADERGCDVIVHRDGRRYSNPELEEQLS